MKSATNNTFSVTALTLKKNRINRLTIRTKIILVLLLIIILMSILNIYTVINFSEYNQKYDTILTNITNANSINDILKTQIDSEMQAIAVGQKKFEAGDQYKILNHVNSRISSIRMSVASDKGLSKLDSVSKTMTSLKEKIDSIGKQISDKKSYDEINGSLDYVNEITQIVEINIQDFIRNELIESNKTKLIIKENFNKAVNINLIALFIISIASIVLAIIISTKISNPIKKLNNNSKQIAAGNLAINKLEVNTKDEIRDLASSFNDMVNSLKEIIGNIRRMSKDTREASEILLQTTDANSQANNEISSSAQLVCEGIHNQNEVVVNTTPKIETLFTTFGTLNANSNTIMFKAKQSVQKAVDGNRYINDLNSEMKNITDIINITNEDTKKLKLRTNEMTSIIKTIGEITANTNLLALNASIEAARAGSSGKGFSVVASEIKKLAERSVMATKEISEIIMSIQNDTNVMSENMDSSVAKMNVGNEIAEITRQYFDDIKVANLNVDNEIQDISQEIANVNNIVEGVYKSIQQIKDISMDNALQGESILAAVEEQSANLEEVLASAQQMSNMAFEMEESIKKFSI